MIERDMRGQVVRILRPLGAFAVENGGCHPGTPDIACVAGWIECKATNQWPAREDTPVRLDHDLTKGQRIFLMQWHRAGGAGWVMLNIAGDWLLFEDIVAVSCVGGRYPGTRQILIDSAVQTWNRKPETDDLIRALQLHPNCRSL